MSCPGVKYDILANFWPYNCFTESNEHILVFNRISSLNSTKRLVNPQEKNNGLSRQNEHGQLQQS